MPQTASAPVVGDQALVAATPVGKDPHILVASDGHAIFRSTDSGCSWNTAFTLAADYWSFSGTADAYSITTLFNGGSAEPVSKQVVYAFISPNPVLAITIATSWGAAPAEMIAVSHDGGANFSVVIPSPTATAPFVPECIGPPDDLAVATSGPRTLFMHCDGAVAQREAENTVSGGPEFLYRTTDDGASWSLIGLPPGLTSVAAASEAGIIAGRGPQELWIAGTWSADPTAKNVLAVWHTLDGGSTWTRSTPAGTAPTSAAPDEMGMALDAPAKGPIRLLAFAPRGVYASPDGGKRWIRLRDGTSSDGALPPTSAFFAGNSVFVLDAGTQIRCKVAPRLLRYPALGKKPQEVPTPVTWGSMGVWSPRLMQSAAGRPLAFGPARFCDKSGSYGGVTLLSYLVR